MSFQRFRATALALLLSFCASTVRGDDDSAAAVLKNAKRRAALEAEAAKRAVAAQNNAMVQQFEEQFRPILGSELGFIRQMCDLAKPQRPKIKAAGEASLKEAATQLAALQQPQFRVRSGDQSQLDPVKVVREGLAKALQETLTPEQLALYTEEAKRRVEDRKQAAILNVVSRLDGTLCLTVQQREKISESIASHWQGPWENWLALQQYGDQYLPLIPDQLVEPHLLSEQKSVWSSIQKVDFGYGGGWGVQGQPENDDWWSG